MYTKHMIPLLWPVALQYRSQAILDHYAIV